MTTPTNLAAATLSDSVQKVHAFLQQSGVPCQFKPLAESTRTAQMAADVLGCSAAEIASSLVFENRDSGALVLIVASGGHRVDVDCVSAQLNMPLQLARGRDIKRHTGFAIGGVPPVAHAQPLPVFLDTALRRFTTVWAAAGSPFAVFGISPAHLAELTGGQWLTVNTAEVPENNHE